MRRVAAHCLVNVEDCICTPVTVLLDGSAHYAGAVPLTAETPCTEWLGGLLCVWPAGEQLPCALPPVVATDGRVPLAVWHCAVLHPCSPREWVRL